MPLHLPVRPLPFILRYALLGAALPCAYLLGTTIAFCCQIRQANIACATLRLPTAPAPARATRLLVFAPHCDDETLGCAGLIQQTLATGGKAQAVILTNGDGFRTAVECQAHSMRIGPADYIRFAALRQQEAYRALANLGLQRDEVRFLGYPDRGLLALWNDNWLPAQLYVSAFTGCNRSPYPNTFRPVTPYCGQSLLDDIKANLRAFRPTLVAVTHPAEDHSDHAAAGAFVTRALQELQGDPAERSWAAHTRLVYYLVHRGDWPPPDADTPLAPPACLAHVDTRWMSLPLTPAQVARKTHSIDLYASQTSMMGRFLHAFAHRTELLGELLPERLRDVPDTTVAWDALPPILIDPVCDDIVRDLNGAADVRALYACRDHHTLYVRLECREELSARYVYIIRVRPFGPHGETPVRVLTLNLRPPGLDGVLYNGGSVTSHGDSLIAAIPLSALQMRDMPMQALALSVETTLQGMTVDKTGVRLLTCEPSPQSTLAAF